jgi:hypothetical protein
VAWTRAELCWQSGQVAVAARSVVTMVIRSGDGMTRSTARPAGINGKMRLDKEIRQLQQTSQMGSLPHRRQTSHKVRENPIVTGADRQVGRWLQA